MWECGLKQKKYENAKEENTVTPYVGVWIETASLPPTGNCVSVTPYVGVWIETLSSHII